MEWSVYIKMEDGGDTISSVRKATLQEAVDDLMIILESRSDELAKAYDKVNAVILEIKEQS